MCLCLCQFKTHFECCFGLSPDCDLGIWTDDLLFLVVIINYYNFDLLSTLFMVEIQLIINEVNCFETKSLS